jgi:ABC-type Na+ efflux pump permease subunit
MFPLYRKDLREWLQAAGLGQNRERLGRYSVLIGLLVVGVLFPLTQPAPVAGGVMVAAAAFFASLSLNAAIADAFAGEKERGTLSALLISPLSDLEIVGAKLLAGLSYALLQTAAMLLVGSAVLLLTGKAAPPAWAYALSLAATLLLGGFFASLEAWVAIGAESMRQALSLVSLPFTLVTLALAFGIPALLRQLSPAQRAALLAWISRLSPGDWAAALAAALLLADLLILLAAVRRLSRLRLES